jgi:hypothetical protein
MTLNPNEYIKWGSPSDFQLNGSQLDTDVKR